MQFASSIYSAGVLLAVSVLLGAATGFRFKVFALVPIAPFVAFVSAAVLHMNDFGAGRGIAAIIACLVLNQAAYMIVQTNLAVDLFRRR